MYANVNRNFTFQKWGLRGQNYIGMFLWCLAHRYIAPDKAFQQKALIYVSYFSTKTETFVDDTHEMRLANIAKTLLFKYIDNFTTQKWKLSDEKILVVFLFVLKT